MSTVSTVRRPAFSRDRDAGLTRMFRTTFTIDKLRISPCFAGQTDVVIPDFGFRTICESGESSKTVSIRKKLTVKEFGRNEFSSDPGSTVPAAQSKVAIPVAWTFMSEILASHRRIVERLSRHINQRFHRVSWRSDRHECPSYE